MMMMMASGKDKRIGVGTSPCGNLSDGDLQADGHGQADSVQLPEEAGSQRLGRCAEEEAWQEEDRSPGLQGGQDIGGSGAHEEPECWCGWLKHEEDHNVRDGFQAQGKVLGAASPDA